MLKVFRGGVGVYGEWGESELLGCEGWCVGGVRVWGGVVLVFGGGFGGGFVGGWSGCWGGGWVVWVGGFLVCGLGGGGVWGGGELESVVGC